MSAEREPLPYDWSEVRQRLQARLPDLLDRLNLKNELPGAERDATRIYPRSPLRADKKAGSFVIWTAGAAVGAWKDYARAKDHGDVLDLVQQVLRLQAKIDVYWWALDFLGLDRRGNTASPRTLAAAEQDRQRRERDREVADAKAAAQNETRSADLFKLWLSLPPIAGTPAEHYLREVRRIPLERLPKMPGALRWAERVELVDQDGEVHEWRHVMVAAQTRGKKLAGLHRTYLKADGSGKADMAKPKLMIGPIRGSAIRLSNGPSGLSPSKAAAAGKRGPLAVGEGIETTLTVACARLDYRAWAAGSLSLMGLIEWPECASAVVLLRENDWKPEAAAEFERVRAHWQAQARGRPLEEVASAVGSDFNDWARKEP